MHLRRPIAALLVCGSGFAEMVLEIIGARYLAKDFGSAFHVWVSQIGVVLAALAFGPSGTRRAKVAGVPNGSGRVGFSGVSLMES